MNGFETTREAGYPLELVSNLDSYTASQIALQLKSVEGAANTFKKNVLDLNKTNKLNIGTMNESTAQDGKALSYTFDAEYNVTDINVPDGWISNTMSYHFTVENKVNN